jgi:transposase
MLKLPENVQIYVATEAADMRKQADGLSALVMKSLSLDPTSGHLFVFFSRSRHIIRILFWDRDGFWVLSKRLERGHFRRLKIDGEATYVTVTASELALLLSGIEFRPKPHKPPIH